MAVWDDIIPKDELGSYERSGLGKIRELGKKPAVLVVDMINCFVNDDQTLGYSKTGREALFSIKKLIDTARPLNVPIIYTTSKLFKNPADRGLWKSGDGKKFFEKEDACEVVAEIRPRSDESLIAKLRPSAFFGTELISLLVYHKIDTLIVTGMVTSGCIRATVVDAFSHNYLVVIPEECVADRNQISHKINLFDMQMKYADVVPLEKVTAYLESLNNK